MCELDGLCHLSFSFRDYQLFLYLNFVVEKYIYSSTILKYNFELLLLWYFRFMLICTFDQ